MSTLFDLEVDEAAWASHGEIFTRRWVVETLLDLTGYRVGIDLGAQVLVEPSAGTGAFLLPAIERLLASATTNDRAPETLGDCIRAWELLRENAAVLSDRVIELLVAHDVAVDVAARLASSWIRVGDFLLADIDVIADVVIGNPPYIRLEDLPPAIMADYRSRWPTMGGRADIYVGFFERSLKLLKPDGQVGFICADRWMRNQYGMGLRVLVSRAYAVDAVWVMHDVDSFEEQVSAYPAITVLRNGPQGPVVAAQGKAGMDESGAAALIRWSESQETGTFEAKGLSAYRLPHWFDGEESWPTGEPARLRLIEHLNDNFEPLQNPRTKTRLSIGVASGADKVFVTRDSNAVEADRLLPMAMARDTRSGEFKWSGHFLVNPWDDEGNLVSLCDFPRLDHYLNTAGEALKARHVAKRSAAGWYRTIDKVYPGLKDKPKLLMQDMRTEIHPVLEPGGHYPHHNLYYVVSETWDMEVLGGLLLSRVAQAFIEAYSVRMRGGTLRFQAQYLKRIRVPRPEDIPKPLADRLRRAFQRRDADAATLAALEAYGVPESDWN